MAEQTNTRNPSESHPPSNTISSPGTTRRTFAAGIAASAAAAPALAIAAPVDPIQPLYDEWRRCRDTCTPSRSDISEDQYNALVADFHEAFVRLSEARAITVEGARCQLEAMQFEYSHLQGKRDHINTGLVNALEPLVGKSEPACAAPVDPHREMIARMDALDDTYAPGVNPEALDESDAIRERMLNTPPQTVDGALAIVERLEREAYLGIYDDVQTSGFGTVRKFLEGLAA